VGRNMDKIGVLARVALLLLVFSCGDKAEKKEVAREDLTEAAKYDEKPKIYDYNLCTDEVMKWDTVGYQLCCKANNACWDQVDSLGNRLSFPELKECGPDCLDRNIKKMNAFVERLRNAKNDSIATEILKEMRQNAKNH